jgi:polyisoprenoid-binding protein YceI
MKKSGLLIALSIFTTGLFAQWAVDKGHSKIAFIVTHHGISEVDGYFKKFEASITSVQSDLSDAVFEMTIESSSINTDLEMRDNSLKGEDLFNAEKYPTITFKSIAFKKIAGNEYSMTGNLTIKGITKLINLEVRMNGPVPNPNTNMKNLQVGIKATGKIKRRDFNVGAKLENAFVSDEIELKITGEFNKSL